MPDAARLTEITFAAVMAAWILFAAAFLLRKRPPGGQVRERDRGGIAGISIQAVGYGLVWTFRRPHGTPLAEVPWPLVALACGSAVLVAFGSVALTMWAIRTLGRHWALAARLVEGHELVTSGPYRWVRNPIYSGMFGMLLATGVAVAAPWALAAGAAVFLAGTVVRVRAEERLLRANFGGAFEAWAGRTAAFLPGLW